MLTSVSLFSGSNSVTGVPAGSAAKTALVGAKTVNGPGRFPRIDKARSRQGRHEDREVGFSRCDVNDAVALR